MAKHGTIHEINLTPYRRDTSIALEPDTASVLPSLLGSGCEF